MIDYVGNIDVDEWVLKLILKKEDGKAWAWLIWDRIGKTGSVHYMR
jgi:hypothetical protein